MFKRAYVEISNICNLRCSFCPPIKREKKNLSVENFEKIIKQVSQVTEEVCLHILGEPLAHPKFKEIVSLCSFYNTKIQLTTNGINFNKFYDFILDSKIIRQVNFSIQCFKDNFPDKKIDEYLLNILNFAVLANKVREDMYINLRLWNIDEKSNDNEDVFLIIEDFFKIKINRKVDVGNIKSKKIFGKLNLHFDSRFKWPDISSSFISCKGSCYALKDHFGVLVDGSVVACCLDKDGEIFLGNCLTEDLNLILKKPRAIKIYEGFKKGILVENLCQHCSYIKRFNKVNKE